MTAPNPPVAFAFPSVLDYLLGVLISTGSGLAIQAVDDVFDPTTGGPYDFLDDIASGRRIGGVQDVTGEVASNGVLDFDDTVLTLPAGFTLGGLLLLVDTGVEATSRLIAYTNRQSDTTALSWETSGNPPTIKWASVGVMKL